MRLGSGLPSIVLETLPCQPPTASLLPIALEGRILVADEALRLELAHELAAPAELGQMLLGAAVQRIKN